MGRYSQLTANEQIMGKIGIGLADLKNPDSLRRKIHRYIIPLDPDYNVIHRLLILVPGPPPRYMPHDDIPTLCLI